MEEVREGEVWENIFDKRRIKVLSCKYYEPFGTTAVEYVKDGLPNKVKKPLNVFLRSYVKIA